MRRSVLFIVASAGTLSTALADTPICTVVYTPNSIMHAFGLTQQNGGQANQADAMINGEKGQQGSLEKKYGVDIVFNRVDDIHQALKDYASGKADAIYSTNIDLHAPEVQATQSVVVLPMSVSNGADACWSVQTDVKGFRGKPVYISNGYAGVYLLSHKLAESGMTLSDVQVKFIPADQWDDKLKEDPNAVVIGRKWTAMSDTQRQDNQNKPDGEKTHQMVATKPLFDSTICNGDIVEVLAFNSNRLKQTGFDNAAVCLADFYYQNVEQRKDRSQPGDPTQQYGTSSDSLMILSSPDQAIRSFENPDMSTRVDSYWSKQDGHSKTGEVDQHLKFSPEYIKKFVSIRTP